MEEKTLPDLIRLFNKFQDEKYECIKYKFSKSKAGYSIEIYSKLGRFLKMTWVNKIGNKASDPELCEFIKMKMTEGD